MKFGIRKPNPKRSFKARTTGKWKRQAKKALIPGYGRMGMGVDTEPQESRLQQDLPEDDVQHLGPAQVRQNMSPAPAGLFLCPPGRTGFSVQHSIHLVYILSPNPIPADMRKPPAGFVPVRVSSGGASGA